MKEVVKSLTGKAVGGNNHIMPPTAVIQEITRLIVVKAFTCFSSKPANLNIFP